MHQSNAQRLDSQFGPTRQVIFLKSHLGVHLRQNAAGYVEVTSVTPSSNSPLAQTGVDIARSGDINVGDIVLEVGDGDWNLRKPIDETSWRG